MKRREFLALTGGGVVATSIYGTGAAQTPPDDRPCPPGTLDAGGNRTPNSPCAPSSGAPAWFSSMADRTWVTPVSNWLGASGVKDPLADTTNALNTGHSSIVLAWTGMGADQQRKTLFMLRNGGHFDYAGNEAYSVDLSVASPAWTRRRNASPSGSRTGNLSKHPDGRPCADHTTSLLIEAEGRWLNPGGASSNYNGGATYAQWWEYSLATEDYIDLGSNHASNGLSVAGLALWDPVDRQIIVMHNGPSSPSAVFQSIDNLTGAPAVQNTTGSLNIGGGMLGAIDPVNRIVLVKADGQNSYYWLRLSNKTANWSGPISASGASVPGTQAFHWHTPSGGFLTWDRAGGLLKLTPTVSNGTYTALNCVAVAGAGGPTPPVGTNLMYTKVQLIQDMGNGRSAVVVVPRYGNPDVFVFRLPSQGV